MSSAEKETQWRGHRDTSRRRLWGVLLVSLLLHLPFTPLAALAGIFGLLLGSPADDVPPAPPITAIPIELLNQEEASGEGAGGPATGETGGPPENPEVIVAEPAPKPKPKPKPREPEPTAEVEADAGVDDAGVDEQLAERAPLDGGADAGPGPAIADPVAASGTAKIADANANVRLLIYTERIRQHPLGGEVSRLLGAIEQWRGFFGPAGLDPIRDIDRILIAGSQLRDSSEVVAVLQHNVGSERVRAAVDALVSLDPYGGWVDAGVPAARAQADRAERLFVMPNDKIVVVTPPSAEKNVLAQARSIKGLPPPKEEEVATAYVVTPWRALIGLPFRLPRSIEWVRVKVETTASGGAVATLVMQDESEQAAADNAAYLERSISALSEINLGPLGALLGKQSHRFIQSVHFEPKDRQIHGHVTVTAAQLRTVLGMASSYAQNLAARRKPPPAGGAEPLPSRRQELEPSVP